MFNSALEASKMVGAKVQTVSGIRGIIKKNLAITTKCPAGTVRVSFEDKVRYSDIVFCRCWAAVQPPKFCQVVTNLLLPLDSSEGGHRHWQGLRTMGQLRHDLSLPVPQRPDSGYRDIQRPVRVDTPLVIPTRLQARLPFKDKPKKAAVKSEERVEAGRPPVVPEPQEQRREDLVRMLGAVASEAAARRRQNNLTRVRRHRKEVAELAERRQVLEKRAAKKRMAQKDKKERAAKRREDRE